MMPLPSPLIHGIHMSHKNKHKDHQPKLSTFKELEIIMSVWLDEVLAAIKTIAQGNSGDPALKAQVAALATKLGTDEGNSAATNAEFKTAIDALIKQLAALPPATGTAPIVSSISATSGSAAGGDSVVITGTFPGATEVHFGSVSAASFTQDSNTQITAITAKQSAGVVDVTVTTLGGVSAPGIQFTIS